MAYKARVRSRKKKQKKVFRKRIIFLLAIIILFFVGYILARIPYTEINNVSVTGNNLVTVEQILLELNNIIERDTSILFPQKQLLFFNPGLAEEEITNIFPEIFKTKITKEINGDISIVIFERAQAYVFCDQVLQACYDMDENGYIYREQIEEQEDTLLLFRSRDSYEIGNEYLSRDQLDQLSQLAEALESDNLEIIEIYDYSLGTIMLITKQGSKVLIPKSDSYDETYSLLKKMIQSGGFTTSSQTKDFRDPLAYINVQFGKKIFSCVRGEICESNYPLQKNDDSL